MSSDDAPEKPPVSPATLAARLPAILLAGWAVPGMSHVMIGQRKKGFFLCALLVGTFVAGQHLGAYRIVDFERHPMSFVGQAGIGSLWGLGAFMTPRLHPPEVEPQHETLGLLYAAVASILNVICVFDAYERVVRMNLPTPSAKDDKKKDKGKSNG